MLATLYPKLPILLEQDLENVALTGKSAPLSPIWRNTPLPPLDLMKDSVRKRRRRRATTPSQMINPLEEGMKELRQEKKMIADCLDRIQKTSIIFDDEISEANDLLNILAAEQQMISDAYGRFFNRNATQIQRIFRGHRGRKRFTSELHNKSARIIQVAFRQMRARRLKRSQRFKKTAKRIIRGLIRIKKRKERIHKEILQRIHQNASFEMNWKHSIGFHATESVIMSGYFHRHKLVKDRLKNVFKRICIMNSIGNYWKQIVLVKQKLKQQSSTFSSYGSHPNNSTTNDSNETENQFSDDLHSVFNTNGETSVQLLSNLHHDEKTSSSNTTSTIYQKDKKRMSKEIPPREELLARQKEYTKRLHENQKRLHAHRLLIEKQKEIIRQIEVKKRLNEMETNNKQTKNRTSSTSQKKQVLLVEKRGLFQEIYQKNKEEIRRQKEIEAHEKIAQEMLSDQTQQILLQKKKKSLSIAYTSTEDNE